MDSNVVQVWKSGRDKYRPVGEPINTREYEVNRMKGDREAKEFVLSAHYSHTFPASRFNYGLYQHGVLKGVAVYSVPCNNKVLDVFPCERKAAVELGRFVLLDECPSNSESWFMSRTFELLKEEGIEGVVSFSDPVARTNTDGALVLAGHAGVAYRSVNAIYVGRASKQTLALLPNGAVFSARAKSKIRAKDVGWQYAVKQLCAFGAEDPTDDSVEGLREWLTLWLPQVTRPLPHGGNLKYLLPLTKQIRKHLPPSLPYLKYRKEPGKPLVILEN